MYLPIHYKTVAGDMAVSQTALLFCYKVEPDGINNTRVITLELPTEMSYFALFACRRFTYNAIFLKLAEMLHDYEGSMEIEIHLDQISNP